MQHGRALSIGSMNVTGPSSAYLKLKSKMAAAAAAAGNKKQLCVLLCHLLLVVGDAAAVVVVGAGASSPPIQAARALHHQTEQLQRGLLRRRLDNDEAPGDGLPAAALNLKKNVEEQATAAAGAGGGIRRMLVGSRAPTTCTYNECRGCRHRCSVQVVPIDASDPINSAYHYKCVCHL